MLAADFCLRAGLKNRGFSVSGLSIGFVRMYGESISVPESFRTLLFGVSCCTPKDVKMCSRMCPGVPVPSQRSQIVVRTLGLSSSMLGRSSWQLVSLSWPAIRCGRTMKGPPSPPHMPLRSPQLQRSSTQMQRLQRPGKAHQVSGHSWRSVGCGAIHPNMLCGHMEVLHSNSRQSQPSKP